MILTFWRKSCFLPREVRFSDGILKSRKTHFSLERVLAGRCLFDLNYYVPVAYVKLDGRGNYVFNRFVWLSRLTSHESNVPCDEVETQQLFTANNGVGTVLLEICPYLYIVNPLCTFLTLIRL